MNKVLIFNTDVRGSGIESLADKQRIQEVFGFPVITAKSWSTIKANVNKLGELKQYTEIEEIGGEKSENVGDKFIFFDIFKDIECLVVDTLDSIYWSIKEFLLGGKTKASQNLWDELLNISAEFFSKFGYMDIPVIMNCHERGGSSGEQEVVEPFLQGSFKSQVGNYFDIILYCKKYKKMSGATEFKWQVAPDSAHDCRATEKLYEYAIKQGGEIPQDYRILFKHVGIKNPKILVIGSYGSGKTFSLRTLKNVEIN